MALEVFKCYRLNHENDDAQDCNLECVVIPLQIDSDGLKLIESGLFNLSWSGLPLHVIETFRRNTLTFPSCTAPLGNASLLDAVKLTEKVVQLTDDELKSYLIHNTGEINRIYYTVHEIGPLDWQLVLAAYVPDPLKQFSIIESRKNKSTEDEYILAEVNIITSLSDDEVNKLKLIEIDNVNSQLQALGFNYKVDSESISSLCFYLAIHPYELKSALSVIRHSLTTFNLRNNIDLKTGYLTVHYII